MENRKQKLTENKFINFTNKVYACKMKSDSFHLDQVWQAFFGQIIDQIINLWAYYQTTQLSTNEWSIISITLDRKHPAETDPYVCGKAMRGFFDSFLKSLEMGVYGEGLHGAWVFVTECQCDDKFSL